MCTKGAGTRAEEHRTRFTKHSRMGPVHEKRIGNVFITPFPSQVSAACTLGRLAECRQARVSEHPYRHMLRICCDLLLQGVGVPRRAQVADLEVQLHRTVWPSPGEHQHVGWFEVVVDGGGAASLRVLAVVHVVQGGEHTLQDVLEDRGVQAPGS